MNKKKQVLVTGGAGFIGSNLCRELLKRGYGVICLDNFMTGRMAHIEALLDNRDFFLIEGDVTEPIDCEADAIMHLACPASPKHYQKDPICTAKTCFLGALHVLELAERNSACVLLTSTSEIYGEPEVHPQSETYRGRVNPIGPRACYDEGKRIAETLFFDAWRTKGTDIRVVRIFNTYGPYMDADDGRVVTNFISQALRGDDITVYGDGSQTRSFCYVDDTVEALIRMMELPGPGKGNGRGSASAGERIPPSAGPVNIGNPSERTVTEVAREIIRQTGSSSGIVFRPLPADDPTKRRPDISRAKTLLQWEPRVSFEEGIRKTIAYFTENQIKERE